MNCSMDGTLGVPDELDREHPQELYSMGAQQHRSIRAPGKDRENAIGKQTEGTP